MMQNPTEISCSRNFLEWLHFQQISLAFTTYQTNRLFLVGIKPDGKLSTFERLFERAMGLAASTDRLYLATRYQIWRFDNNLRPQQTYKHYDKVYVPHISYTTGDIDVHDLAVDNQGNLIFVNTLYNCLATLSESYSFTALWQPAFISKLAAEDRCHLNGLAMVEGKPGYVTTISQSDMTDGWRDNRNQGGCLIEISSNEIIRDSLSMPHSPRYYQGKLWVLNSGRGEFGHVDLTTGKFEPITFCPGYPRGLAFWHDYAIIGISKPRDKSFTGLDLDELLTTKKIKPRCGLVLINLQTGDIVHWLWIEGVITELYDVQVLPNVRCGMSLGFKTSEIAQLITFEEAGESGRCGNELVGIKIKNPISNIDLTATTEQAINALAQNHLKLAKQFKQAGKIESAIANLRQAIKLNPNFVAAYNNLGTILQTQEQLAEAKQCYEKALAINPDTAETHSNLATIWQLEGDLAQAKIGFLKALQIKPNYEPALTNLANIYQREGNFTQAKAILNRVLQQQPNNISALFKLANLLKEEGYLDDALKIFNSLLQLQSERADIYIAIAQIHEFRLELQSAANAYKKALDLEPDNLVYASVYNYTRLKLADWENYQENLAQITNLIESHLKEGKSNPISPYVLNSYPLDNSLYLEVAKRQAEDIKISVKEIKANCNFTHKVEPKQKIKLGYISADFRTHVVGRLIQDIFSYHDRERFTIYGYYLLNAEDANTEKIRSNCDRWRNFYQVSAQEAATNIYNDGIDILIDLGGYTVYSRPEILALQPAPIQMQFLGYPNTMGADFIQYMIADKWLIPDELAPYYTEEILYLPHAYVSSPLAIAEKSLTKADFGLPEDAFVFCCFNRHDKIEPEVFSTWMKIMQQVPNSIFWLSDCLEEVKNNLHHAAAKYNISPQRILFASKLDEADYLARYQVTDLFLDTFIYNAGSTGTAALWGGVPLLTCAGQTNAGRIGASLCAAVGLEEMICQTKDEYEQKAVYLSQNPEELASIRKRLNTNKEKMPLFNLPQFVADLEAALWALQS